jgi:hypothetical protein
MKTLATLANLSFWFLLWFISGLVLKLNDSGIRGYVIVSIITAGGLIFSSIVIWKCSIFLGGERTEK